MPNYSPRSASVWTVSCILGDFLGGPRVSGFAYGQSVLLGLFRGASVLSGNLHCRIFAFGVLAPKNIPHHDVNDDVISVFKFNPFLTR